MAIRRKIVWSGPFDDCCQRLNSKPKANRPSMKEPLTLGESLRRQGVLRSGFLKSCAAMAPLIALLPAMIPRISEALERARRSSVIWLPFEECTGCLESLTRSYAPATIEGLLFNAISLDYQETLQAAAGTAAEHVGQ